MVYLLKMVIFHGKLLNNQRVMFPLNQSIDGIIEADLMTPEAENPGQMGGYKLLLKWYS